MQKIITLRYHYIGDTYHDQPHGHGTYVYNNGDTYIGDSQYGRLDGFGKYIYHAARYTGFFSFNKFHGEGTFEDIYNIYKGPWRNDQRHGIFYKTDKILKKSYKQFWQSDTLIANDEILFVDPQSLATKRHNTRKLFVSNNPCVGCCTSRALCAIVSCGHVVMCEFCLSQCKTCPICRIPIDRIIKLFIC
jgi:hypothetical protein